MKLRRKISVEDGTRMQRIVTVGAMRLLVFSMLLTSIQIAVYGDSHYSFYRKEYDKYCVPHVLRMDIDDIMVVTEYMMDYLIGKAENLSVETEVDGTVQDFFNEQDRLHMADVRNLFLDGLKLRNICVGVSIILLFGIFIMGKHGFRLLVYGYLRALTLFVVLGIFFAIIFTIDFTDCFTIFHKIFFTNDLWLFDPATDYMIRMLPEGFFSDMVIRIAVIFGIESVFVGGVWLSVGKFAEKKWKKNCRHDVEGIGEK